VARPTVLLFDVDGTLLTTPGCGRRALERAFAALHGAHDVLRDVRFDGMTDRAIVRAGLIRLGQPESAEAIDAVLDAYVPYLEEEIAGTPGLALHRGVGELLSGLEDRPGIALGLGTGNIRPGARAKLQPLGIFERFRFGGFGCDHEDRAEILRLGAERGAALLRESVDACRVVVIGDTPRDVAAARAIGAECVAVGSASYACEALLASGATRAFASLADAGVLEAVAGDHGRGERRT
jgi:phosphoglycolate phosphatase-like HAD superfamily hydrolase